MLLEIITPEKVVFREEIDELTVPTEQGEITILPHHINLMTKIVPGEMTAKIKNKEQYMAITGGFLEVHKDTISILAEFAIRAEDIEVQKVIEAQKRAEEKLKRTAEQISERDMAIAQADLRRSLLEFKVANKRKARMLPRASE